MRGIHAPRQFFLRKSCVHPRFDHGLRQRELFFKRVIFLPVSLIAMAGKSVVMKAGALMMIHDPRAITVGNLAEHNKSVEMLDKMSEQYASVYAKNPESQCRRFVT